MSSTDVTLTDAVGVILGPEAEETLRRRFEQDNYFDEYSANLELKQELSLTQVDLRHTFDQNNGEVPEVFYVAITRLTENDVISDTPSNPFFGLDNRLAEATEEELNEIQILLDYLGQGYGHLQAFVAVSIY